VISKNKCRESGVIDHGGAPWPGCSGLYCHGPML
jgi:hypothetical protein